MKNLLDNRIFTLFVALILACFLWLLVRGELQVRKTIHMTLQYPKSEDRIVVGARDKVLEIDLRGPMALVSSLANENLQLEIDYRSRPPGAVVQGNLETLVRRELPRGLEVVKIAPREIRFQVDLIQRRSVSITLATVGQPARGFQVGTVDLKPDRVTLIGAASVLQTMETIPLEGVNVSGAQETITVERELKSPRPEVWPEEKASVKVQVQILEQTLAKTFEVPIEVVHTPFSYAVGPPGIAIEVEGGLNLIESLTAGDFAAYIEGRNLPAGSYRRAVAFRIPKGVKWLNNSPRYFHLRLWKDGGGLN